MALTRCLVLVALLAGVAAVEVKPIAKVVALIEGLKKEVEDEGAKEADSYDKFACFCKDATTKKSDSVLKGNDQIKGLSADIAEKTNERKDSLTEQTERKANQEKLSKDLDDTNARCAKEKAEYEAAEADLSKAVSSLKKAIKAMTQTGGKASLIAVKSVVSSLQDMRTTSASAQKAMSTILLQNAVDPTDPEYGYHSQDIVELCKELLGDFTGQKKDLDSEWGKTDKACKETKASLAKEMKSNKQAIDQLGKDIQRLAKEIATHREDLVEAEGQLKDDELYLKDLTARCEERANDYDQRSQMRGSELGALTSALDALNNKVVDADKVNKRALLQTAKAPIAEKASLSFLQGTLVKTQAKNLLAANTALEQEAKKEQALNLLRSEGRRLGSVMIASLTVRAAGDPFKKVKGLIQKLIERLLQESEAEASKKGFCDEAVGKAEHDREARFMESTDLNREIASLESKEDELVEEIKVLTKDIREEKEELKETTEDRGEEKDNNLDNIKVAKDGLAGVTEALQTLKSFYSSAAKASLIQASPVDEDTAGAGFSGSYKGKQGGMKAVFALLETISSDFDRTIRKTEEAENKAHRGFVEFSQTSKSSIAGKSTKKELDEQDLKTTRTTIKSKMADMQANINLLDDALQELETLKPQCIDTGMSYKDRVAKREEEMEALQRAHDILQ